MEDDTHLAAAVMLSLAAGLCSAFGALLTVMLAGPDLPLHRLACSHAALGAALLFLGCCDLLPEAAAGISLARTLGFFALGASGSALASRCLRVRGLARFVVPAHVHLRPAVAPRARRDARPRPRRDAREIPGSAAPPAHPHAHPPPAPRGDRAAARETASVRGVHPRDSVERVLHSTEVLIVGLVTFVSLSVHNLLEGMSILFAVREGLESGLRLAAAISLENVPEGICIALPLYFATRRKSIAIRLALFSGMMEPLGVLLPGLFLPTYMTQTSISSVLAIIAGILVFVALAEMLPLAVKTAGTRTMASLSVWMGCGVLSATLFQPLLMYHGRVGRVQ